MRDYFWKKYLAFSKFFIELALVLPISQWDITDPIEICHKGWLRSLLRLGKVGQGMLMVDHVWLFTSPSSQRHQWEMSIRYLKRLDFSINTSSHLRRDFGILKTWFWNFFLLSSISDTFWMWFCENLFWMSLIEID